jgi:hypothetical protein
MDNGLIENKIDLEIADLNQESEIWIPGLEVIAPK